MKSLRVLGIDPAAAGATGYGLVEVTGPHAQAVRAGTFRMPTGMAPAARLHGIHRKIAGLIEEFAPDAIAVESVFAALNLRSALVLAEVRGVILLAAEQAAVPVHSYSPREVKLSVAGYGNASKQQVQQMVKALLRLVSPPEPVDAADALAVALCHAHVSRARARLGEAVTAGRHGKSARGRKGAVAERKQVRTIRGPAQ
jgi:crossover junction endodeoxyribonuclease RuvC